MARKSAVASAAAVFERLGHAERLEGLSRRLPLPHCPEFELDYFRRVNFEVLRAALGSLEGEEGTEALAWRGRARRLVGDVAGARRDLEDAARDGSGLGLMWLGELDLGTEAGERRLREAVPLLGKNPLPAYYLGVSLLMRGRAEEAALELTRYLRARSGSCVAWLMLGVAKERLGDVRGALVCYARAARAEPASPVPHLMRAHALKDDAAAARACEDAFDAEPEYAHVAMYEYEKGCDWPKLLRRLVDYVFEDQRHLSLSARFLKQDRKILPYHFEYVKWAEDLLRLRPGRSWTWGLLGRALSRCPPASGYQVRGLAALDRAVKISPHRGWVYGWRGLGFIANKRPHEALKDLDRCLARQPYYCWAYEWRGALLHTLGRPRQALVDLDRAAATNQHYPFSINRRGLVLRELGDYAGAVSNLDEAFRLDMRYCWVFPNGREAKASELKSGIAELTRAIKRLPSIPSLWTWRGQTRLQQRDYTGAFRDFEAAVALDPANALAHAWYGRALSESGRPADACRRLRKSIEIAPDRWLYRLWLADALRGSGEPAQALALLDLLVAERPRGWWAWQGRARVLLDLGRVKDALASAREASELEGRNADNYFLEAEALLGLKRLPEAEAAVDKLLAISPHYGKAWILRAEIRSRRGRADESRADYRHALVKFPFLFNDEQRRGLGALLGTP
jgi:tetratricopeptide (TPR) repeat protein